MWELEGLMEAKKLEQIHDELWKYSQELKSLHTLFTGTGAFQFESTDLVGVGLILRKIQEGIEEAHDKLEDFSTVLYGKTLKENQ